MDAFWVAFAFVAGALIPVQGAFNTKLSLALENPVYASLVSFLVGTIGIGVYVLTTRQVVSWSGFESTPWYAWLGGLIGGFVLTAIILFFPRLGPGLGFSLLIAGQLVASVLLEHFGILVTEQHPINFLRLAGIVIILCGVVMIRIF